VYRGVVSRKLTSKLRNPKEFAVLFEIPISEFQSVQKESFLRLTKNASFKEAANLTLDVKY